MGQIGHHHRQVFLITCGGRELYQLGEKVRCGRWPHTAENTYFVHDVEFLELMIEEDAKSKPKNKSVSLKFRAPWGLDQVMPDWSGLNRQFLQR
jgi:hypothetical protein